jgi:hypothetical protein
MGMSESLVITAAEILAGREFVVTHRRVDGPAGSHLLPVLSAAEKAERIRALTGI